MANQKRNGTDGGSEPTRSKDADSEELDALRNEIEAINRSLP